MRKTGIVCLLFALALSLVTPAVAQMDKTGASGPPPLIQIIREDVKPGRMYMHTQHEAAWTRAMINAKFDTPLLAMTSVTGANEAWFIAPYASYAAFEKDADRLMGNANMRTIMETNTAKESEYVQDSRTMLAAYRENLSYHPNFKVGEYRYFSINTVRARIGQDIADLYKPLNENRERANLDEHFVVFQVISGAPSGTYLVFRPLKSLADMDAPPNQTLQDANRDAKLGDIAAKVFMSTEPRIFAFAPEMSSVTPDVVALNPTFWKPKPMMAKKAAAAGAETPAAKKEADKK